MLYYIIFLYYDYIFLPYSYVFVLKLRGSLLNSLKITFRKIVKSILRCRKDINSQKNSFWKKTFAKNELHINAIARTARGDDSNNNTHLFPLIQECLWAKTQYIHDWISYLTKNSHQIYKRGLKLKANMCYNILKMRFSKAPKLTLKFHTSGFILHKML